MLETSLEELSDETKIPVPEQLLTRFHLILLAFDDHSRVMPSLFADVT